jgi:hypothetical protein
MTTTNPHTEAVQWIREVFLPKKFGQKFQKKNLGLQSRGQTEFHAVSEDEEVVAQICTSASHTSTGKVDTEALMKVRSDALKILWLEHTPAKRFIIFTDSSMIRVIREEIKKGHFPKEMEILRVDLPAALAAKIDEEQKKSAKDQSSDIGAPLTE